MTRRALCRRFRYDGREIIALADAQLRARDAIRCNILSGEYAMEQVHCPLCGDAESTPLAEKDFYGFPARTVACNACGMVYSSPRLTVPALNRMYAVEYRDLDRAIPSSSAYFELEKEKAASITQLLRAQGLDTRLTGRLIVEVGCGAGGGLQFFRELGHPVAGCDLSPTNVSFGTSQGLDVCWGTLATLREVLGPRASEIGLIIYEQVFEHLADPKHELAELAQWLPPGALLYIGVPGIKNIAAHYGSDFLRYVQLPHLCHYELRTLAAIAQSRGFVRLYGDEIARAIFHYDKDRISEPDVDYGNQDIIRYLVRNEARRNVRAPLLALKSLPVEAGLRLRILISSSALPAPVKRIFNSALKALYGMLYK